MLGFLLFWGLHFFAAVEDHLFFNIISALLHVKNHLFFNIHMRYIYSCNVSERNNISGKYVQVRGAISALKYTEQFPQLPADFEIPGQRDMDMFDLLEYVFGFQVGA